MPEGISDTAELLPLYPGRTRRRAADPGCTLSLMGVTAADLLEQVMALPDGERNDFVAKLISRYPAPEDVPEVDSPEWVAEIERRARRALAGESTADDWEVAEERILARLADE